MAVGLTRSIRRSNQVEVIASLTADMEWVARVYCGINLEDDDDFVETCVTFVLKNFAHLGVDELKESFSLAAAGKLGEIDLSAYYGKFTVKILGEVLRKYQSFRNRVVQELRKVQEKIAEAEQTARQRVNQEKWRQEHRVWCENRLKQLITSENIGTNKIALPLYDYLVETGKLDISKEEKWALMERAKPIAKASFQSDLASETNHYKKLALSAMLEQVDAGKQIDRFKNWQTVVARQLAVLDWINEQKNQ